jgi:hypothetical protein
MVAGALAPRPTSPPPEVYGSGAASQQILATLLS